LIDPEQVSAALREKIVLEAPEASVLLRDWMNALLGLAARQQILFLDIRFQEFQATPGSPSRLKAEVVGELMDPLRHSFRKNPGSLTCREVALDSEAGRFTARITFFD
jgi:SHS2 domain-containing protein